MFKKIAIFFTALCIAGLFWIVTSQKNNSNNLLSDIKENISEGGLIDELNPLSIQTLRKEDYPGSDFIIEQTLESGSIYSKYIATYKSEGLKIYGLLTIPTGEMPKNGWPAIIFNHGYIPPGEYRTTERYAAYQDAFARNGYVLFKSDYRGHGNSEGNASGSYGSNSYAIDVLNAVSSVKKLKQPDTGESIVDSSNLGMWGHSMGGHITLRNMVAKKDIKAGVIWAGVVASYPDLLSRWRRNRPSPTISQQARGWRQTLVEKFGDPEKNPDFWNSISANSYLADVSGPIQLHHGTADTSVPFEFSEKLSEQMKSAGKTAELYIYPGDDHNITNNFNIASQRSVDFFDKYLKKGGDNL